MNEKQIALFFNLILKIGKMRSLVMWKLCYYHVMSLEEIFNLNIGDYSLGYLMVTGRSRKIRVFKLTEECDFLLRKYLHILELENKLERDNPMFFSRVGKRITKQSIINEFKKLTYSIDIKVTPKHLQLAGYARLISLSDNRKMFLEFIGRIIEPNLPSKLKLFLIDRLFESEFNLVTKLNINLDKKIKEIKNEHRNDFEGNIFPSVKKNYGANLANLGKS